MIIDSHCHLNILPTDKVGVVEDVIKLANENDVKLMLCVAINPEQWHELIALAERFNEVYATIGIHPCEPENILLNRKKFMELARHPKVLAIGEIGLDYFHFEKNTDIEWQKQRFRQQINIAKQLNKPIVIHNRNSTEDCLRILAEENAQEVGGIMHCFVESLSVAKRAIELGFYISFSGIVTFKNAKEVKEVATKIPLEYLLVETDSPYLAPVPYRGKANQPAYTRYVVEEIARLRNISTEMVAKASTQNFQRLMNI